MIHEGLLQPRPRRAARRGGKEALARAAGPLAQLVADEKQLGRFREAAEAGGGELLMVMLVDPGRDATGRYAHGLEELAVRERCAEITCHRDDVDGGYRQLLTVVAADG